MEKYFKSFNYDCMTCKKKGPSLNNASDYIFLCKYNYTVSELKSIGDKMEIPKYKKTKKNELVIYTVNMIFLKYTIVKIQRLWRKHLICNFNKTLGPSFYNHQISNNIDDFFTSEEIREIDYYNFYSFRDEDNFVYTFNIISIFTLIKNKSLENPYNRKKFKPEIISQVALRIRYNKILNQMSIFEEYSPKETTFEDKLHKVFAKIDELGNFSNASWFLNMDGLHIKRFLYELFEIWNFRTQLSQSRKVEISPPNGNPFYNIPRSALINNSNTLHDRNSLRVMSLGAMERLVFRATSDSDKTLGALYILMALTLSTLEARHALPWLYESANYIN